MLTKKRRNHNQRLPGCPFFLSNHPHTRNKKTPGSPPTHSLKVKEMNEKKAVELLRKYSTDEKSFDAVYRHSKAVQKIALRIASEIKDADIEFIKTACILHDIGRFKIDYPKGETILHGIRGAEILRKEGVDEKFALVCERHLGAGIVKEEIVSRNLPLPKKDFVPVTKEEKIIAYADNLECGDEERTIEWVIKRFQKEVGYNCTGRIKKLHEEIIKMQNGSQ